MFRRIGFLFCCLLLVWFTPCAEATENKVIRNKKSNFQFNSKNVQSQSLKHSFSSSSSSSTTTNNNSQNAKSSFYPATVLLKKTTSQLPQTLKRFAFDLKDELIDCFDAVVFAESTAEVC